jgi:L-asparaginase
MVVGTQVRATEPAVAVLYGSAWSPGDVARDGAAEFEVLLCVARIRQAAPLAGIVGVGSRRGSFPPAAEVALERVAHMGVPVVRLAQTGTLHANDGDVFIEAGGLAAAEAKRLLGECLVQYGSLPAAADPANPTKKEKSAIQAKLALYQLQFNARNATQIAMR